ncbi:MAG: 50S ribosomal protein L22 [Flavobacteriales bacterium]|nr:50S ribosomal protein L22 [Flavobacteriales bacterium]MCX7768040.1 50S ribosomal protein L22 [Flavobacteriales bacterium]MDW8409245.1 50S ribosomal protein L22 [Flavobacteriales bacterium]
MGARKRLSAQARKEAKRHRFVARLRNCPTSPRKMRLVVDLIRGKDVNEALDILQFTNKEAAPRLSKLLRSAIANFEQKTGMRAEDSGLYVAEAFVDSARILKRIRPAPQGRAYRIRKRSNHVTVVLGSEAYKKMILEKESEKISAEQPNEKS